MPLFVIATPIGNLDDVSQRAIDTLNNCDKLLCEDTRIASKLLKRYEITTKCTPYHDHNAARVLPAILEELKSGATFGLVSDAGTPLIADPGYRLVTEAIAAGITIIPIPGACAITTALSCAGLPTNKFYFGGFLPRTEFALKKEITQMQHLPITLVYFESPHRITHQLQRLAEHMPNRFAVIARELTKKFETVHRGRLDSLATLLASQTVSIKGEWAILIGPVDYTPTWASIDC